MVGLERWCRGREQVLRWSKTPLASFTILLGLVADIFINYYSVYAAIFSCPLTITRFQSCFYDATMQPRKQSMGKKN